MQRWAFNIVTVLSAGLLAVVVVGWPVSYWRGYVVRQVQGDSRYAIGGGRGKIMVGWQAGNRYAAPLRWGCDLTSPYVIDHELARAGGTVLGFSLHSATSGAFRIRFVSFPHWLLALAFAVLPCWRLRENRRQHRRERLGLCLACGYDLCAHAPGQLCPECGTPVPEDFTRKPMA